MSASKVDLTSKGHFTIMSTNKERPGIENMRTAF